MLKNINVSETIDIDDRYNEDKSFKIRQERKNSIKKNFIILGILVVISLVAFLLIGLNTNNISTMKYALNRRFKVIGAIILVAYSVSYSTINFQTITNNQILTPSVMGLDSLYLFIQTIVIFLFGSSGLTMLTGTANFLISLGLMVGLSLLLFGLMFKNKSQNVYFLVLVGMIFGTLFSGLSNFLQVLIDPNEYDVLLGRMFASFSRINTDLLLIAGIITLIIVVISIRDYSNLDVLSLGKNNAINLGLNYNKSVIKSLVIISILTSVSTILVGPVTFLGILVASLARRMFPTYKHKILVWGTFLISLVMLFIGMILTERVFKFVTPLSVIINFFGGIYFIYMLIREGRYRK